MRVGRRRRPRPASRAALRHASRATCSATTTAFDDYWAFLEPRLRRGLAPARPTTARSTCTSTTARSHYAKVLLDALFGRECFLNEIIWAYDYGGRAEEPLAGQARHDPGLREGPGRATTSTRRASTASRTWRPGWSPPRRRRAASCRPTSGGTPSSRPTGKEKTGYPTQKPRGHPAPHRAGVQPRPGDWVLDFFAGSGTTGAVAAELGRRFLLVDENPRPSTSMAIRRLTTLHRVCGSNAHRSGDLEGSTDGAHLTARRRDTAVRGRRPRCPLLRSVARATIGGVVCLPQPVGLARPRGSRRTR